MGNVRIPPLPMATKPTIKASDLRIGNWVITKDGKFIKVENVNDGGINGEWDIEWCVYHLEDIQPIPLTPSILDGS